MKLKIGPGALVSAAFIGPGTVTACTLAGANFGYHLIWALVFATGATILLQSMAARLGVVTGDGLGRAMMGQSMPQAVKLGLAGLALAAIAIGNGAYEAGNLTGGALGVEAIFGADGASRPVSLIVLSAMAAALLLSGRYELVERALLGLVGLMSLGFIGSFLLVRPDLGALLAGLVPSVPTGGLLTTVALIGTTIVPYNLFLHAAAASRRWREGGAGNVAEAVADTRLSVGLGGLVSILIMATAAATLFQSSLTVTGAGDFAVAIEPAAGPAARYLIGIGLLAAGLTSAITAPLATAYVATEILPLGQRGEGTTTFRIVAIAVILAGLIASLLGTSPLALILFAQMANGLLLPVVAVFLLVAVNRRALMGDAINTPLQNALGGGVVLVTILLGARLVLRTLGVWP